MIFQHVLSLGVFSSYFLAIILLFALICRDIRGLKPSPGTNHGRTLIFFGLTMTSLAHTWFYMFKYMAWSFANYEHRLASSQTQDFLHRVASWLFDTSLFEEAWSTVCSHPLNWWWSEQLCTFTTGTWTAFIAIEGKRHRVKHLWAYMLLGQIVAISVASNLFYLALIRSQSSQQNETIHRLKANFKLWASVLLSLAAVAFSSSTSRGLFLPNLLVMHALLFVPLVGSASTSSVQSATPFSVEIGYFFRIIQLVAAGIHVRTVLAAIDYLKQNSLHSMSHIASVAWGILHSHPAQSSIGWDVIWTTVSFIIWILVKPNRPQEGSKTVSIVYLLLATPASSIGVAAPYVLRTIMEPPSMIGTKLD